MLKSFTKATAITPDDTNVLTVPHDAIYVGVTGDVTVDMAITGTGVLFKGVPAGTVLYGKVKKIKSTGTTATNLLALAY